MKIKPQPYSKKVPIKTWNPSSKKYFYKIIKVRYKNESRYITTSYMQQLSCICNYFLYLKNCYNTTSRQYHQKRCVSNIYNITTVQSSLQNLFWVGCWVNFCFRITCMTIIALSSLSKMSETFLSWRNSQLAYLDI